MTTRFNKAEKVISVLLIIWGGMSLYLFIQGYYYIYSSLIASGSLNWQNVSLLRIVKNFHLPILLPFAAIYAGFRMAFDHKDGWIVALIVLLSNGLLLFIPTEQKGWIFSIATDPVYCFSLFFIVCGLTLLFVILILKPFRIKYEFTNKVGLMVALATVLILIDKFMVALNILTIKKTAYNMVLQKAGATEVQWSVGH